MTSPSLHDPACLYALDRAFNSPSLTARLATRWRTWAELAAADITELARISGGRALRVATTCPPPPSLPPDCRAVGRFDVQYPARLADLADVPNVLFVTGTMPDGPAVTIGGGAHPSAQGYHTARRAAELAVAHGATVIAAIGNGCGDAATDAALDAGGRVVVVAPYGINLMQATNRRLIEEIVRSGGAVVSCIDPDQPRTEATSYASARLAVALSPAVVLAEAGLHEGGGISTAVAALEARRYLIVSDHHDPRLADLASLGSLALSRTDPLTVLGEHPQLTERMAAGKTPADAVITCDKDLSAAIAYGTGASDTPPPDRDQSGWVTLA